MPTLELIIDSRRAKVGAEEFNRAVSRVTRSSRDAEGSTKRLSKSVAGSGEAALLAGRAIKGLVATFVSVAAARQAIRTIVDFERGLVAVGKTSDLSGGELLGLGQDIIDLSTRIPATTDELLELGEAAGQLGVTGRENLLKFSQTLAFLGSASDLGGAEGAKSLARILNVTGESIGNVDKLGAAIVALGNTNAASENEIANLAKQLAQSTAIYKLTSAEALALGASFASLGSRAETAASATSRTLSAIEGALADRTQAIVAFTQAAGTSIEEFQELFARDRIAGFQVFLSTLQGLSSIDQKRLLQQFQLDAVEITKTIPVLASRSEILSQNLERARLEFELATAAQIEAGKAADTVGGQLSRLRNVISAVILEAREIAGPLKDFVSTTADVIKVIFDLDGAAKTASPELTNLARQVEGVAASLVTLGALKTVLPAVVGGVKALTAALAANPVGLIAIGVAAGIGALVSFRKEIIEVRGETLELGSIVLALFEEIGGSLAAAGRIGFAILRRTFENVVSGVRQAFEAIVGFVGPVFEDIAKLWNAFGPQVIESFKKTTNTIIALFVGVKDAIREVFSLVEKFIRISAEFDITAPFESAKRIVDRGALELLAQSLDPRSEVQKIRESFERAFEQDFVGDLGDALIDIGANLARDFRLGFVEFLEEEGLEADFQRVVDAFDFEGVAQRVIDNARRRTAQSRDFRIPETVTNVPLGPEEDLFLASQGRLPSSSSGVGGSSILGEQAAQQKDQLDRMIASLELENDLLTLNSQERQRQIDIENVRLQAQEAGLENASELATRFDELTARIDRVEEFRRRFELLGAEIGGFLTEAVLDFENLNESAQRFAENLARIALQEALIAPLVSQFGNLGAIVGGARSPAQSSNALGGVELFTRPTFLRSGNREVKMAEAGTEALIAPVERDSTGKLGVRTTAAPRGPTNVYMTVVTPDARSFRDSERQIIGDLRRKLG